MERRKQSQVRQQHRESRGGGILLVLLLAGAGAAAQSGDATCDLLNSSSLRANALAAMEKHRYSLAVREFQQALDACPKQRAILLDLAAAHAHNRDFPPAIHAVQQFLEAEPISIPGRLALANVYFMAQQFPESRADANRFYSLTPLNRRRSSFRAISII